MPESLENAATSSAASDADRAAVSHRPVGVFEALVAQHRQAAELFERLETMGDSAERREPWNELRGFILSHERAEDVELYAALEGHEAAREVLERHAREVIDIESLIDELDAMDHDSQRWRGVFAKLAEAFEAHVRQEEAEFFPRAQEILGQERSRDMQERFEGAQRQLRAALG